MSLPPEAALIFLGPVAILCALTVWTDLSRMKIPNWITDLLLLAFLPLGFLALPWQDALWQWLHPLAMFALGLGLHAIRAIGAGDIKFLMAASPYIMRPDLGRVMMLLAACLLIGALLHRAARATIGPKLAPGWESWKQRKRYPMGLSLGPALVLYLAFAAAGWPG